MTHIKYRAVVDPQFFGTVVNGMPLNCVADDFLPYGIAKVGPGHYSMGCCHKSTPVLFTEETLFAAFVLIADSLCAAAMGQSGIPVVDWMPEVFLLHQAVY